MGKNRRSRRLGRKRYSLGILKRGRRLAERDWGGNERIPVFKTTKKELASTGRSHHKEKGYQFERRREGSVLKEGKKASGVFYHARLWQGNTARERENHPPVRLQNTLRRKKRPKSKKAGATDLRRGSGGTS